MSFNPGIHLFYPSQKQIAHAFFDGMVWTGGQPVSITGLPQEMYWPAGAWGTNHRESRTVPLPDLFHGVSAVYLSSQNLIYVFYTGSDSAVYVLSWSSGASSLQYIGTVPSVSTGDMTAVAEKDGQIFLYYKDTGSVNNNALAYTVLEMSGNSLTVAAPPVAITLHGQPTNWGPAVVMRGGSPNIVYNDNNNYLRMAWQTGGSSWAQIDPRDASQNLDAWLNYSPAAVLVGVNIFALYHASHSSHDLYCDICDPNGNWTQNVANSTGEKNQQYIIGGGPGACVFGGRVFCFMQGSNNNMYCQIYMGNQWLPQPLLVADENGNSLCANVWWGPAAVAV